MKSSHVWQNHNFSTRTANIVLRIGISPIATDVIYLFIVSFIAFGQIFGEGIDNVVVPDGMVDIILSPIVSTPLDLVNA